MLRLTCLVAALVGIVSMPAHALTTTADGVVIFNQNDVAAGNITPGDTPGFPVTISKTGVYRLGSVLLMNKADLAIAVSAPFVTIDLNNFTISGNNSLGTRGVNTAARGLTVINGGIRGFRYYGILSAADDLTVRGVRVTENSSAGIYQYNGRFAKISESAATQNGVGIYCGGQCSVSNSIIGANRNAGIVFSARGGIITGSTISENIGYGLSCFNSAEIVGIPVGFSQNILVGNTAGNRIGCVPMDPNAEF